jgi:hypothetical protein
MGLLQPCEAEESAATLLDSVRLVQTSKRRIEEGELGGVRAA